MYLTSALHRELDSLGSSGAAPVLAAFLRHCDHFRPTLVDVDACLGALVRCNFGGALEEEKLIRLLQHLQEALPSASGYGDAGRQIAHSAWALARLLGSQAALSAELMARVDYLFAEIERVARPLLDDKFDLRNIAVLAWALAKVGKGSQALFGELGDAALIRADKLTLQESSVLVWTFATVKLRHELLSKLTSRVIEEESELKETPGSFISMLVWGYATLSTRQAELFRAAAAVAQARIHRFNVIGIANLMWAFAHLREHAPFQHAVLEHLQRDRRWEQLELQGCSMILWSLARLRHDGRGELFYHFLADRKLVPQADFFQAQDLSNSLWAFATARVRHAPVFRALAARASAIAASFNPQALANTLWACARLQMAPPQLLAAAAGEVLRRPLRAWRPQALVTVLWACCESGDRRPELLAAVAAELEARAAAFNDVDLATLAAVCGGQGADRWPEAAAGARRAVLRRAAEECSRRDLPRTRLCLETHAGGQP